MSDQSDTIANLVNTFGLSSDEAKIYVYLLSHDFRSALELSRQLSIARTKVYRLIEKLSDKKLLVKKLDDRGMRFGAASPEVFSDMVHDQLRISQNMQQQLPDITQKLQSLAHMHHSQSKVLYYEGIEGLKQVSYNLIKAKDRLRVFEMKRLSEFLPKDFAEDIRSKLVANKITTYDLTNEKEISGFTSISEMITTFSKYRYIDPKKLLIEFEIIIYNDVYVTYSYHQDKIFALEIYNAQLASMQKQLFDFVWNQAIPMTFMDKRGSAKVTHISDSKTAENPSSGL